MVQTEAVSVESILQCSRTNKDKILAALLRERMAERQIPIIPFSIKDEKGELIGAFHPEPVKWERSKTPPPMTPEERAAIEEALCHPEQTFTLEEFLREEYPEDFHPRS